MLLDEVVCRSPAFVEIVNLARRIANADLNVLITGETGTGKDFIAEAIHDASIRRLHPFLKIDCASIPASLAESEFFGYEKGAFSDASQNKLGKLQLAKGGTIYLDGINHLSSNVQSKLLRFAQDHTMEPLGSSRSYTVDCRIISSFSCPLETCLKEQQIRQDLYFRLSGILLELPPLRDRKPDIEVLAKQLLKQFNEKYKKKTQLSAETLDLLKQYRWPGNIRELRNVIEQSVIHANGAIYPRDLFFHESIASSQSLSYSAELLCSMEDVEKRYIAEVLRSVKGHNGKASQILKINRKTLLIKRRKYGLDSGNRSK